MKVSVSGDDPRWGEKVTITAVPAVGSAWSKPKARDTLFCAAIVHGAQPAHALVIPMARTSGNAYTAQVTIPDSAYSLDVRICTPFDEFGNTGFTCRTRDGKPTPGYYIASAQSSEAIASAFEKDLARYPKNYALFVNAYYQARLLAQAEGSKKSDSDWTALKASLIRTLQKNPDSTVSYYLALGTLRSLNQEDSLTARAFSNAARCVAFDPVVNDAAFWNHFFYPTVTKSGIKWNYVGFRALAPLAVRYPHSQLAIHWLETSGIDSLLPAAQYKVLARVYSGSHDVDLLMAIGQTYGSKKSPLYNPERAIEWLDRAETSSRDEAGFYSGENIWGSMDRLPRILTAKAYALDDAGKTSEAIDVALSALPLVKQQFEKPDVKNAIAWTYLQAGRLEDAKRAYADALASGTQNHIPGLEDLYTKCKQGTETLNEFTERLEKTYEPNPDLPAIPDFTFTTLDGMHSSLAELRGKVVVIDCWFISCPGCAAERASMDSLAKSYASDTNVVFLSIALDGAQALRAYLAHSSSHFKTVPIGYGLCQKLGVNGFPTHIIIDRHGKTVGFEFGRAEGAAMRPKIEDALRRM